jgi:ubiquinone/menaquinone biosynthesis C-methylase UbiE
VPARRRLALLGSGAALGAALWWRKRPHPFITRERLREILQPVGGERLLEIGPGSGYYTLEVAHWLSPVGRLDIVDVDERMLEETMRRARAAGFGNITPARADARELPFDDDTFDGAYLVAVLGEIPDQVAALRELARVVRPGGRVVVGELFGDPHMVTHAALAERAEEAGLWVERKLGGTLWHFTRLQG